MTSNMHTTHKMKKRDSEVISTSSGASRGSDYRKGSTFSLRRLFQLRRSRNRSKSHVSLDSDSGRSEISFNITHGSMTTVVSAPNPIVHVTSQSVCYAQKRKEPTSGNLRECPVCMVEQEADQFPDIMTCEHRTCQDCLKHYLQIEISESRINIACPECAEQFHPNDIRMILQDSAMMQKYEEFMLRRVLATDPDARWCPAPDCGYAVIAAGCAGCPKLKCESPGCDTFFCYHCKQPWHPNQTCDAARAERYPNIRSSSLSYSNETGSQRDDIKPCPRCSALFVKMNDGSCNHMTCAVCGAEFCWLCMKEISDLHYLSPSGCTFWGKKPWSRKKKILWQLGTLVGAPVGITLVASIAIPAMIIGIPVWVGRKIHARYEGRTSRHRRNLAITGGVAASILVSPIIAGLAVGIGVPILLAYVYGVVPVSLCRSGGCGVTTNTGGVRFEFDENVEGNPSGKFQFRAADSHSVDTAHHVANPSIAPSIGDASLGMTNSLSASGSHMDRVGVLRDESQSDRDSASNRAIAGSSLNGSLCGSMYAALAGYQNKLEVQADVSTNALSHKRASFSSESANISLSERSATVSFGDDCSTKALAGSILGYKDKDGTSIASPPFEVQPEILDSISYCQDFDETSAGSIKEDAVSRGQLSASNSPPLRRSTSNDLDDVKTHKSKKCTRFMDDYPAETGLYACAETVTSVFKEQRDVVRDSKKNSLVFQNNNLDTSKSETNVDDGTIDMSKGPKSFLCVCLSTGMSERLDTLSQESVDVSAILAEVENDKPSCTKTVSTPVLSSSSPVLGTTDAAKISISCTSIQSDIQCPLNDQGFSKRRYSCELAYKNGRLSPSALQ